MTPPIPKKPWLYNKDFKHYETDNLLMLSAIMQVRVWSPIVWHDGIRRNSNFLKARYIALDFDDGEFSLAAAVNDFCDQVHIIGTTKSHQKPKGNALACDRFRLVLKLSDTITSVRQYVATIEPLAQRYSADKASVDGARYFFPCKDIVSICTEGFTVDPAPTPPNQIKMPHAQKLHYEQLKYKESRGFKGWLKQFLKQGKLPKFAEDSRNRTCYEAAYKMLYAGISPEKIEEMIWSAPFGKKDFPRAELIKAIRSAVRRFENNNQAKSVTEGINPP